MMVTLVILGFLSALTLGPAGFSIVQKLIQEKRWPWAEISGFFLGDFIYLGLSLLLLQSSLIQKASLKIGLTLATSLVLVLFSISMIRRETNQSPDSKTRRGFWRSLLLTLGNFHLVLIYTGLFTGVLNGNNQKLFQGAALYAISFALGFLLLLLVLLHFQATFQKLLRRIEILVGYSFIFFSFYLTWGAL